MIDTDDSTSRSLERVPTSLAGLDAVLGGGVFRGGVYMLLGAPGTGKTILGSQIAFAHVAAGGRALFVTLLTESHARLIASIQKLAFFDPARVGSVLSYVAAYQPLEKDGLKGLMAYLRQLVRDDKATLLVIDGFVTADSMADSDVETKKFIHELQAFVELVGCTTFLLTGASPSGEQYALRTMVDGLIELRLELVGMKAGRTLEVKKFRGSRILIGRHRFDISDTGVTVFPRIESRPAKTLVRPEPVPGLAAKFGIAGIDEMVGGGLRRGSVTMALGALGAGKTLLGLSFLSAGAKEGEPGVYFGFFETPLDVCRKAEAIGLHLTDHVKSGLVEMLWQRPFDAIADALAEKLLAIVRERGARRVFLDGLSGFKESLLYPDRTRAFFGALFDELRSLGVVTLLSDEMHAPDEIDRSGITAMLDNILCLRHVETKTGVDKMVSLVKTREGGCDPALRPFAITGRGFDVPSASSRSPKKGSKGRRRHPR